MALNMRGYLMASLPQLRFERTAKRVRVGHGGLTICDTTAALLVWEPRRLVPVYAVPEDRVDAELAPAGERVRTTPADLPPVVGPERFGMHTCPGQPLDVRVAGEVLATAAFRPDDPDLAGYVLLGFSPFDWLEEDEPVVGHPHDPFQRIDTLRSSRHVVVSLDGVVLADSRRTVALLETRLPTRWYFPRDDVHTDRLERSDHRTTCAYKGHASYFSVVGAGEKGRAIAWTYPEPLHDALPVADMVCFFAERTDLTIDDASVPRPVTPWSTREEQAFRPGGHVVGRLRVGGCCPARGNPADASLDVDAAVTCGRGCDRWLTTAATSARLSAREARSSRPVVRGAVCGSGHQDNPPYTLATRAKGDGDRRRTVLQGQLRGSAARGTCPGQLVQIL